jgi:transaldolase
MTDTSALRRLTELNPDTEVWWDTSPLVFENWLSERRLAWTNRPDLLGALDELTFSSLDGVLCGCTTNPPLALEAFERCREGWLSWARDHRTDADSVSGLAWLVYCEILRRGAEQVLPLWEQSKGRCGQICGQVDPRLLDDRDAMVAQGTQLYATCPNVMVKMPATEAGIDGIRVLTSLGISTNATLGFTVSQILATAEAARAGQAEARAAGVDLSRTRSMATLMLGRMEDAPAFAEQASVVGVTLSEADRRWAGIAVARRAYRLLEERQMETKLLLASMRLGPTIDGKASIWHLEMLAGGDTVLTIFPNILASFIETYATRRLEPAIEDPIPETVLARLLRVPYFVAAYELEGVAPAEYGAIPGLVLTSTSFSASMQALEDAVSAEWCAAEARQGNARAYRDPMHPVTVGRQGLVSHDPRHG